MTRSDIKTYSYKNVEEALSAVNAQDHGRYFLCTCPECNQPEAFIYKNNPQFLNCNRDNECGASIVFEYEENQKVSNWKGKQELHDPEITPEQKKEIALVTRLLKHVQFNTENKSLENYRGLSRDTTKSFLLDLGSEKLVETMFRKAPNLFYSKKVMQKEGKMVNYADIPDMLKRNLVLPIYGDDGMVDRILLRSSIDTDLSKKEIQLQVNPKSSAKDFFKDIPENATHIVVGESPIDGFSFREIDKDIGVYGLTGSRKWRRVIDDIKQNKEELKDKVFIIATDNDKAGIEARESIKHALEEEKLNYRLFVYELEGINDPNEYLKQNREAFKQAYANIINNFLDRNSKDSPQLEQRLVINYLYRTQQEEKDRTQFRFSYEGLTIEDVAVDFPPGSLVVRGDNQALKIGERMEGILKYIAQKAPLNQDYTDIVIPEKSNSTTELVILSYKKENSMTTKLDFQIGEVTVKNVVVDSLPDGSDPMVFYPCSNKGNVKRPLVTATHEFNESLIKSVRQYEKEHNKKQTVKPRLEECIER